MFVFISRQGLLSPREARGSDNTVHTKYFLYERCTNTTQCSRDPPPSQLILISSGELLSLNYGCIFILIRMGQLAEEI